MSELPENYEPDFAPVVHQAVPAPAGPRPLTTCSHCYITHSGVGLKRFRLVEATSFGNIRPQIRRHLHRYAIYKFFTERHLRPREENLLLLHNHWSTGYFHWVTDVLLKLMFLDLAAYEVLLPEDYPGFARESLSLFDARIFPIPPRRGISVATLTAVHNRVSAGFDRDQIEWLRTTFTTRCGGPSRGPARIYITRHNAGLRRVENEDEVIAILQGYDFEVVDTATLPFCQQVRMFAGCETVVSVHGAGLANCAFMSPGAQVLELYRTLNDRGPVMNTSYWQLARTAGLRYYYQFCDHGQNFGPDIDRTNIVVNTDKLQRNVELMLSAPVGAR